MEKYNKLIQNIAGLIEKGLYTSKEIKKELEDSIKFEIENILNKLNLVTRDEFEIQKKIVEKLEKKINKNKFKKKNKSTKAKKL